MRASLSSRLSPHGVVVVEQASPSHRYRMASAANMARVETSSISVFTCPDAAIPDVHETWRSPDLSIPQ